MNEFTYHVILSIVNEDGVTKVKRQDTESHNLPDEQGLVYWEDYYTDNYTYPNNVSAVVVNVFKVGES